FRRSLERSQPADSIVRKLYALIAQCHRQLGRRDQALAACLAGRHHYPDDVELLLQEALARMDLNDVSGAVRCWSRLLQVLPGTHFASIDAGLAGYKARHNLAVLYQQNGRPAEAETQWRVALSEKPDFVPAWLGVGEVCLTQARWEELEGTARSV